MTKIINTIITIAAIGLSILICLVIPFFIATFPVILCIVKDDFAYSVFLIFSIPASVYVFEKFTDVIKKKS